MITCVCSGDEYCVSVEAFDAVMKGCESNAQDLHDEYMKKMEDHKVSVGRLRSACNQVKVISEFIK